MRLRARGEDDDRSRLGAFAWWPSRRMLFLVVVLILLAVESFLALNLRGGKSKTDSVQVLGETVTAGDTTPKFDPAKTMIVGEADAPTDTVGADLSETFDTEPPLTVATTPESPTTPTVATVQAAPLPRPPSGVASAAS